MNSQIFPEKSPIGAHFLTQREVPFCLHFFSPSRAENDTQKRINLRTTERHNRNHPRTHGAKEIHSFARAAHQF